MTGKDCGQRPPVIVTDNATRARLQFPRERIVSSVDGVMTLPEGAKVAIADYGRGSQAITAARAVAKRGHLEIVAMETNGDPT